MSDLTHRDQGQAFLKRTTVGWSTAKNYSAAKLATTLWGKGLAELAQISAANSAYRDAGVAFLKKTTGGYKPTSKNWKLAFAELAKIVDAPAGGWTKIADEYQNFTLSATSEVRYGTGSAWNSKVLGPGTYQCGNPLFGDPLPGANKACERRSGVVPPPAGGVYPSSSLYPAEVRP